MSKTTKKSTTTARKSKGRIGRVNKRTVLPLFVLLFALAGTALLILTKAATPTSYFEAESGSGLTSGATVVADGDASGGQAIVFNTAEQGFVHPGVVYSQADINSWTTSNPDYTTLKNSSLGCLTSCAAKYTPIEYNGIINTNPSNPGDSTTELNMGLKDQSGYAKVQAILYKADGNQARKDKVISYLSKYRTVTSYEWDSVEQYRLVSGWGCTNLAQAAELVNYQDDAFKSFLRDKCYPIMDWSTNPNWHAAFADSKLAIAAYLGDQELWNDAKKYLYERIRQSIYLAEYDNGKANPMHTEEQATNVGTPSSHVLPRMHSGAGTPKLSPTQTHWGKSYDTAGIGQVNADYTFNSKYGAAVDGMNAERLRDLGHINLSLTGWLHGLMTIKAQGESNSTEYQEAFKRLKAAYSYHAQRVQTFANNGNSLTGLNPLPAGTGNSGGDAWKGYYGARRLFGSGTPTSVTGLISGNSNVNSSFALTVSNANIIERFADGN